MHKIAIHGVPRSGTSWVGTIFDSSPIVAYRHQPLFSYGHKSALNENSTEMEINSFFDSIYKTKDPFVLQAEPKRQGLVPKFEKSPTRVCVYKEARYHNILDNMMKQCLDVKVIAITRNPLSVLASWKNAPKEFLPSWDFENEWRFASAKNQDKPEEFYGFYKWLEVCKLFNYLEYTYPERFKIVNYSELISQTIDTVNDMFQFCGIPLEEQTRRYLIEASEIDKSEHAYSVYRSNPSDQKWVTQLSSEVVEEVKALLKKEGLSSYIQRI